MATSHRYPYCPKIVKLVHVKSPNAQKLKFVFICWNACLPLAKRAPQRRATSLCAHCHPMTMLTGTTAFFCYFSEVYSLNVCPSFGKWAPWEGTSRGCFTALSPPPKIVSGTQKVFKKCGLSKWKKRFYSPTHLFFSCLIKEYKSILIL